ncbi:MAG: acyl-CoA/acyl-ACP dehydrogenase [Thermoleophilia bacterium]|nr:acyl-CoA/acyl-ACP dehydrogenase [Thermoleophilia bacterium]
MNAVAAGAGVAAERHEIVALARELSRRELAPLALALDERRPGAFEAAWTPIAEAGYDRALLAVEDGGVGLDVGLFLLCLEEIGSGDAGVALVVLLANAALAAMPPVRAAQVAEAERWVLVPVPSDRLVTPAQLAFGVEPDGRTVIAGMLSPSLGALGADGIVIVKGGEEPAVLVLAADTPELRIGSCEHQLGLRSAASARISLSGAMAEAATDHATAGAAATASLCLLHAGCAAIARGITRRARDMAFEYAQARSQGGVAIVEHGAVRQMLAAMSVGLATVPVQIGAVLDETATLAAKVAASDAAAAASTDAVQIFGGAGYMHETGVEKLMRDAKYLQLWPEPNWMADDRIIDSELGRR